VTSGGPAEEYQAQIEAAVDKAIAQLNLETKVRLLTGKNFWATYEVPEIGLREIVVSDGPAGVKGGSVDHDESTTSFPSPTAYAATWDESLVRELGELLAAEARAKNVDVLLGPTINLHRSPIGGRHFEQFSEDPLLTGRLAAAYVDGLQSKGVGGCPKHYVCNDSETERQSLLVDVDERTLHELYLAPFERTVREARAWSVMAAYSGVQPHKMTESPLLTDPLETDWGFDGIVMSDWFATHSTVEAGRAALDLQMPGPYGTWGDALLAAVRDGRVPESAIDAKVRRILRLGARVGALEGVPPATPIAVRPPQSEVSTLVRRAAVAGTVLLRNDGILPLDPGKLRRVAVIGPNANVPPSQGGGSSNVRAEYGITPLEGLRAALPAGVEILSRTMDRYRAGFRELASSEVRLPAQAGADAGKPGILVRVLAEDGPADAPVATAACHEVGRMARVDGQLNWNGEERLVGRPILEFSASVTSQETGRHRLALGARGNVAVWLDGQLAYQGGAPVDTEDIDAIWGDAPFQGPELEMTAGHPVELVVGLRKSYDHNAAFLDLSIEKPVVDRAAAFAEAERLAAAADVVVLCIGTTALDESEGYDRTTLSLQPDQDELVRRVAGVNPRIVVVISAGSPVLMPWRDDVAAVLLNWFPGQEGGNALADVLLGLVEPGGRMPTTWPVATEDAPVIDTKPVDGILRYPEGLNIGYRAWLNTEVEPAFPFGHGLGYTKWTYLDADVVVGAESPTVRATLRNAGTRRGREIVQLYLARPDSSIERPLLWLAGWNAVEADAGMETTVAIPIDPQALRYWDETSGGWAVESGRYEVRIGRSVGDLRLAAVIDIEG